VGGLSAGSWPWLWWKSWTIIIINTEEGNILHTYAWSKLEVMARRLKLNLTSLLYEKKANVSHFSFVVYYSATNCWSKRDTTWMIPIYSRTSSLDSFLVEQLPFLFIQCQILGWWKLDQTPQNFPFPQMKVLNSKIVW
jgi:hypothetical protein